MIRMVLQEPAPRRQPETQTTLSPACTNPDFLPKSIPKFTRASTSSVQSDLSSPKEHKTLKNYNSLSP
jgi:hypothetical protein